MPLFNNIRTRRPGVTGTSGDLTLTNVAGQEDLYRESPPGFRVTNTGEARIVATASADLVRYRVRYGLDPDDLDQTTDWIDLDEEGRTVEHFLSGPLDADVYAFEIDAEDTAGREATSGTHYFIIGCDDGGGGYPPWDPAYRSRWHLWCEVGDADGPSYSDGDPVPEIYNASTLTSFVPLASSTGDGTYRAEAVGGKPAVEDTGSEVAGYDQKNVTIDKRFYPLHIFALFQLPAGALDGSNYVTIFRTGNLGSFGGYSMWRLYADRIDVWHTSYGFYPATGFGYSIPLSVAVPTGEPMLLTIRGNEAEQRVTVRINGAIAGGVTEPSWTGTAGSTNTGKVAVRVFPDSDDSDGSFLATLLFGGERDIWLDESIVGASAEHLMDAYGIAGEYEPGG